MAILCWAAKGGSGTTVVAAALALGHERPVTLVDLAGDLPAVLGLPEPDGPGVHDWVRSDAPPERLARLAVEVTDRVDLVPAGTGRADRDDPRWDLLADHLAAPDDVVVVDAGTGAPPPALHERAEPALLVTRPCYLSLRRAVALDEQPTGVVLVVEPGRALGERDVAAALGAPVVAELHLDPAVARAVDAGLLSARVPRALTRSLRGAA